jgi:NIPSNAP
MRNSKWSPATSCGEPAAGDVNAAFGRLRKPQSDGGPECSRHSPRRARPALGTRVGRDKCKNGGEGGIRTHDTLASMPHFECGAFNHSTTSPGAVSGRPLLACSLASGNTRAWRNPVARWTGAAAWARGALRARAGPARLARGPVDRRQAREATAAFNADCQGTPDMLYDVRTYTVRAGTLAAHLALYKEKGWTAQTRHLGQPFAYFVTETGPLNTYMHIWAYKDAADRATRRAAMAADPEWIAFLAESAKAGYLVAQENRLMTQAPFFKPSAP